MKRKREGEKGKGDGSRKLKRRAEGKEGRQGKGNKEMEKGIRKGKGKSFNRTKSFYNDQLTVKK